jgi:YegS/Rv2252/BmrU family lipid kinase
MTLIALHPARQPIDAGPRILVIYNPAAGRRRRRFLDAVLDELARAGARIALRATTRRGDAERFAREASAEAFDRLVIAGGDGTINEAINGLADRRLPVAIIPLGTANVLAAELGLPADARRLAAAIATGFPRNVVVGSVNGRAFTMMAGIGFDAHVVAHVSPKLKRLTGKLAYVVETLVQLWRYRPAYYEVDVDGKRHRAASAIVAKGHFYGGRFVCAPDARLERPELHACLFGSAGRWHVIRYAAALLLGRLHRLHDVLIVPARSVAIAGPAGEPVQGDGDTVGHLPARIELAPGALRLIGA